MSELQTIDLLCKRDYHCQKHERGVSWLEAQCYSCVIEKQQAEIAGTAVAIAELADCLRAAEAQKERCAGITAGEWRALFIKTQDQWQAAEAEVKCLKRLIYGE